MLSEFWIVARTRMGGPKRDQPPRGNTKRAKALNNGLDKHVHNSAIVPSQQADLNGLQ